MTTCFDCIIFLIYYVIYVFQVSEICLLFRSSKWYSGYVCLDFNLTLRYFQLNVNLIKCRRHATLSRLSKNKSSCTRRIVWKMMASQNSWRSLLFWPIIFCILRTGSMILCRGSNSTSYLKNLFHSVFA